MLTPAQRAPCCLFSAPADCRGADDPCPKEASRTAGWTFGACSSYLCAWLFANYTPGYKSPRGARPLCEELRGQRAALAEGWALQPRQAGGRHAGGAPCGPALMHGGAGFLQEAPPERGRLVWEAEPPCAAGSGQTWAPKPSQGALLCQGLVRGRGRMPESCLRGRPGESESWGRCWWQLRAWCHLGTT